MNVKVKKGLVKAIVGITTGLMIGMYGMTAYACTTILVGKEASSDGSRILGRTVDTHEMHGCEVIVNPAINESGTYMFEDPYSGWKSELPAKRYRYVVTPVLLRAVQGLYSEFGENEYGVCISATESFYASEAALEADPLVEDGVSEAVIPDIILPYVTTAREGVELLGKYADEIGIGESNGVILADDEETWYVELYTGHHWAAVRMPEDAYAVIGNEAMIGEIDLTDEENYMASADLIEYAKENEFYQEIDGRFHVAASYGDELSDYGQIRVWAGRKEFGDKTDGYDVNTRYTIFDKPGHKISLMEAMELSKYRYEDTEYDVNETNMRPIGIERSGQCHFMQFREDQETVLWLCPSAAEFGVYVPFYGDITQVPDALTTNGKTYTEDSLCWQMRQLNSVCAVDREIYGKPAREALNQLQEALIEGVVEMDRELDKSTDKSASANSLFQEMTDVTMKEYGEILADTYTRMADVNIERANNYGH